jgi:catechol 2,3-dioxygenase-like lactoylglutathione lyase family enzyme
MPAIDLDHYNITAPRALLDEIRDFYCDSVGLVPGARPPLRNDGYWLYAGNRAILHLSAAGDNETRLTHVATTIDHVAFACVDFAAMRAKLKTLGISHRYSEVPSMQLRQLFFQDPAGNGVELNFGPGESSR